MSKNSIMKELNSFNTSSKISFLEILGHFESKKTAFFWLSSRNNHEVHPPKRNLFHVNFNKKREGGKRTNNYSYALFQFPYLRLMRYDLTFFLTNIYISFEEELDSKIPKKNVKSQKSIQNKGVFQIFRCFVLLLCVTIFISF